MTVFIIIFGTLTLIAGIIIVIKPEFIFGFLRSNADQFELQILAVILRLVLGVFLISQSNDSKFPVTIEILGWLSMIAAMFLAVIGRRNFNRLMSWALSLVKRYGRISGVIAAAFGAFLIYAFQGL